MALSALLLLAPLAAFGQAATTPGGALPQLEPPPVPQTPAPSPIEQPPTAQPPADTEADRGSVARMEVNGFRIEGVVERADYGIHRTDIEQYAIDSIQRNGGRFGIDEFRRLTQTITRHYRSRGLFLARAYIPEQSIVDGIVEIRVIEGLLAKATTNGNRLYSDRQLTQNLDPWIDQPVHVSVVEREMLILNAYPGLAVTGLFRPGETLGTTTLVIDTKREQVVQAFASLDNYGTEFTGVNRALFGINWNNPTGAADQFRGALLQTFRPANNNYWSLGYTRPVFSPINQLELSYTTNSFTVGQILEALNIEGESTIFGAALRRQFIISRDTRLSGVVDFSRKSASSTQSITDIGKDELSVFTLGGQFEFSDRRFLGNNLLRAAWSFGLPDAFGAMDENGGGVSSRIGGSGARAGGDFSKIRIDYSRLQALPEIPLFRNQDLLLRVQTQISGDLLTSLEQMSLGGPNSVRAYPPSEVLADSATFLSVEWLARTAPGSTSGMFKNLRLAAFFDYASGEINDPLANEAASVTLTGIGMGVRFSPRTNLEAKVEFATSIGDPEPSNDASLQTFFNLHYTF